MLFRILNPKGDKMKRYPLLLAFVAAFLPLPAYAHKAWLLPSQTVLSGADPWVTVDAAVSNDLFYFNHVPLRLDNLVITAPDGTQVEPQNLATGKYRNVFDLQLTQQGTYRIAVVNKGLMASWQADGKPRRWRGSAEAFATEVPTDATNLRVSESVGRIETFVTNGAPSEKAIEPTGVGIEIVSLSHPNDMYAGEEARFRVMIDGKPVSDLKLEIIRGGTRYRDSQDEMMVTSDAAGEFSVAWPEAGFYWIETSSQGGQSTHPQATERRLTYVATIEVLPQ